MSFWGEAWSIAASLFSNWDQEHLIPAALEGEYGEVVQLAHEL